MTKIDLNTELTLLIQNQDKKSWDQLIKFFYNNRNHERLDELVEYAEKQLGSWGEELRFQMANNFHFMTSTKLSPVVKLLRHIRISRKSEEWGSKYLNLLSASAYVSKLRSLSIESCDLYFGTITSLFQSSQLSSLNRFVLKNTLMDNGEIYTLLQSPMLQKLKVLALVGEKINDDWLSAFSMAKPFPQLVELNLSYNHISDIGAKIISQAAIWDRLYRLDLKGNRLSGLGKKMILDSGLMTKDVEIIF